MPMAVLTGAVEERVDRIVTILSIAFVILSNPRELLKARASYRRIVAMDSTELESSSRTAIGCVANVTLVVS